MPVLRAFQEPWNADDRSEVTAIHRTAQRQRGARNRVPVANQSARRDRPTRLSP